MSETVLITGGAGFIGSHLVDRLLCEDYHVVILDNFNNYYDPILKRRNVESAAKHPHCKIILGDIENEEQLRKLFSETKIDIVVHLAARAGVRPSINAPQAYIRTNIMGTLNILEMMREFCVKKLIFASSSSVYGNCKAERFSEDLNVAQPISPYAATKSSCEQIIHTYTHLYQIQSICLRFFTVYGPRQRPDLAINKFVHKIRQHQPIEMYGDGTTMRDYTFIDDIVWGIRAAMQYDSSKYEILNLGAGQPITLKQMIETIEEALHIKADICKLPMQPGDVEKTIADISKASLLLGYNPHINFKEGIRRFINSTSSM